MSGLDIEAEPASVGLDAGRLTRIDDVLAATLSAGRLPGWVLAVGRHGRLAHASVAGHRDLAAGLPVETDTLFRIYSMTKPVTAVAAMILYERGAFELSDPVERFIPAFADTRVFVGGSDVRPITERATRSITMRHLLTHTAGLTYGFHRAHPVDALYRQAGHEIEAPDETLAESCETWARLPLLFQPGTEWNYSVATDVVGRVVEVISGQRLGEFCAANIFAPLGMTDTMFHVPDAGAGRLARLYLTTPSGGLEPGERVGAGVLNPDRAHYGGGGLVSTAPDYLRFATMLLNRGSHGDVRILGPRTVAFMTGNHLPRGADLAEFGRPMITESPLEGVGQALGMSVMIDPVRAAILSSPGEFGWGGAASTVFWVDPELELVVVFMTQVLPAVALPIRNLLHQLVQQAVLD
jgi:CubicO group peptidase (beta-lactamase class C family)